MIGAIMLKKTLEHTRDLIINPNQENLESALTFVMGIKLKARGIDPTTLVDVAQSMRNPTTIYGILYGGTIIEFDTKDDPTKEECELATKHDRSLS
jgi:hypothetical protein